MREIKAVLPHLATKADIATVKVDIQTVKTDVANLHAAMIKWMVGTMFGGTAAEGASDEDSRQQSEQTRKGESPPLGPNRAPLSASRPQPATP